MRVTMGSWQGRAASVAVLVALNGFVYAQVRSFDFVNFDDDVYLLDNERVAAYLCWTRRQGCGGESLPPREPS